jgi:hypothetical protein
VSIAGIMTATFELEWEWEPRGGGRDFLPETNVELQSEPPIEPDNPDGTEYEAVFFFYDPDEDDEGGRYRTQLQWRAVFPEGGATMLRRGYLDLSWD